MSYQNRAYLTPRAYVELTGKDGKKYRAGDEIPEDEAELRAKFVHQLEVRGPAGHVSPPVVHEPLRESVPESPQPEDLESDA